MINEIPAGVLVLDSNLGVVISNSKLSEGIFKGAANISGLPGMLGMSEMLLDMHHTVIAIPEAEEEAL